MVKVNFHNLGVKSVVGLLKDDVGLVYTTLGTLGASVFGALFWLVLASILRVDNYGLVNYYIALAQILAGVGTVGLNMTLTTFLAKGEKKLLYEVNSLTLITGLLSTLVLSALNWAAGLLSATLIFFSMAQAEMLGRKNYKEYALALTGQRIAQIVLSLGLYFVLGLTGIVLGYFLGAFMFSYRFFASLKNFSLDLTSLREKRNFAIHSYGYNLVGLSNYLDKVIVGSFFGYYILGLYQLGFQFFMFLDMVPMSLQQYLLPMESSGSDRRKIKVLAFLFSIVAAVALFVASPYLVNTFFPTFTDAVPIVRLISFSVIPSTISAILVSSFLGNQKSRPVFIAGVLYLSTLVGGIIVAGTFLGAIGLAVAIIVAKTLPAIYLIFNRKIKLHK